MNENNYTYNPENQQQNSVSYAHDIQSEAADRTAPDYQARKNKGMPVPKALKVFLLIICMAAVSAGSVAGYKYIDENGNPFSGKAGKKASVSSSAFENARKLPADDEEDKEKEESAESTDYFVNGSLVNVSAGKETLTTQAIYRKVLPSVVGVSTTFEVSGGTSMNDFWSAFGYGYGSGGSQTREVTGTGTGIIMSEDGYILTNAHVIADDEYGVGTKISVRLYDETEYDAVIVGYDKQTDLAVLKADASELVPAEFGSSSSLKVGDPALAIGNPLGFDLFGTLTAGYVSGLNREISVNDTTMKLIQTDAAINNGNSGGPLINQFGQVVGINSMKLSSSYSSSSATIEGLGFAIPIDDAKKIIDDLTANGFVTGRPQLGITYKDLSQGSGYYMQGGSSSGVMVAGVNENGPADKAGIKAGDIIVGADGELVSGAEDLKAAINEYEAGETIHLTIIRNRNYYDVDVTLEDQTPDASK